MTKSLIISLLLLLLNFHRCWGQEVKIDSLPREKRANLDTKSPPGAMIRSLVFPGWGQWYNGKRLKALLIFAVETSLIANSIYLNQKLAASSTREEREFYRDNRNLSNWWLVGTILLSMADAYVDAHLYNFDEGPNLSLKINSNHRKSSPQLCLLLSISF